MNLTIKDICKFDKNELKVVLEKELKNLGYDPINEDGFLYAEGTYPVMLCAHMDTVHHDRCTIICESSDGKYLMSPQGIGGDDRCGIYMVLRTLEQIHCSVCFTEDEEVGCVGARKFAASKYRPKNLNYIVEYDRKGKDDAVFYSCDNPEFTSFVTDEEIGFKEDTGSCSDISQIAPALGVAAVNISSGYYSQHTLHEYINVEQMENNIQRGMKLILKPSEKFEYIHKKYNYTDYTSKYNYKNYGGYYGSYYDYDWYDSKYLENRSKISKSEKKDKKNEIEELLLEEGVEIPEPPFDLDDVLYPEFGMILDPIQHYIKSDDTYYNFDAYGDYCMDKKGTLYCYFEETGMYYPCVAEMRAYNKLDDTPVIYDEMEADDIIWGYLADLEKIIEYADTLNEFDLTYGSDFETEYLNEVMNYATSCNKYNL